MSTDASAPKREPVDLQRLRELCDAATPGNWRVAMHGYNVKSDLTGTLHDGDYLENICAVPCGPKATLKAVRQFQPDADFIAAARNASPDLAAFAVAFVEALPRLQREHDINCDEVVRDLRGRGREVPDCVCGADTHNAELAKLAALLGVTFQG